MTQSVNKDVLRGYKLACSARRRIRMIKIDIMSMDKKPQNARLPTECSGVLF